jgi:hypothetical protein
MFSLLEQLFLWLLRWFGANCFLFITSSSRWLEEGKYEMSLGMEKMVWSLRLKKLLETHQGKFFFIEMTDI